MLENVPQCPKCNHPMGKAGFIWSGKNRRQRWKCNRCGSTTILIKPKS